MEATEVQQRTEQKSFDNPDEVREFPNGRAEILKIGDGEVGRYTFQPGWHWENDVKPIVGTHSCEVPHFQETFAICVQSANSGGRLVFGADSRPTEQLVRFACDADLLLIEATLPRPERSGERGHLTQREAGEHGRDSRVSRLVLTHISDELDELLARKEAEDVFDGPVEVAREGAVYSL